MSSAFNRALSPLAAASLPGYQAVPIVATEGANIPTFDADLVSRHSAISRASSVDEVLSLVPPGWREALAGELRGVYRATLLREEKQSRLKTLKGHKATGTFPAFIPKSRPRVQGSKELMATTEGTAIDARIQQSWDQMRTKMLDEAITSAELEVSLVSNRLNDEAVWNALAAQVAKAAPMIMERRKVAVFGQGLDAPPTAFVVSPVYEQERAGVLTDMVVWARHCELLAASKHWLENEKKSAKKSAKDASSSAAMDTSPDGSSNIEKVVQRTMNREMKKYKKLQAARVSGTFSTTHCESQFVDFFVAECIRVCHRRSLDWTRYEARLEEEQQAEEAFTALSHRCRRSGCHRRQQEGQGEGQTGGPEGEAEGEEGTGEEVRLGTHPILGTSRDRNESDARGIFLPRFLIFNCNKNVFCRCALHESEGPFGHIGLHWRQLCEVHFKWDHPITYPDWFLLIDRAEMCDYIVARTPLYILEASRFRNYVHLSTGVTMPVELQVHLAVGMKYMLPAPHWAFDRVRSEYQDLANRLRWRIHFLFQNGGQDTDDYDPDWEVEHTTALAPTSLRYIEHGLRAGEKIVHRAVESCRTSLEPLSRDHNIVRKDYGLRAVKPEFHAVRRFLLDNDLIVTGTDKNLGIAVSQRQWYLQKCLDLLQSPSDYQELSLLEADDILLGQCADMETLALMVEEWDEPFIKGVAQLPRYLRSLQPTKGSRPHIPKFHGIPKIHKTPTAMRPIIPCHSAVINPAAKFVHKVLAPLVKDRELFWSICESSRQLAQELRNLVLPTSRKVYLCTGDVVAMYPNIPIDVCMTRVSFLAKRWYSRGLESDITDDSFWKTFELAMKVGNTNLISQFDGKFYLQKRGLAMGVSDSPTLANIHAASYEFSIGKNLGKRKDQVLFYRRYIDDVFCVLLADSEQEARQLLNDGVKIKGCELKWDVSTMSVVFLDLWVYLNPTRPGEIHFKPYRKANNHRERLPYISHHPHDVKKGIFIGELSRLAALSSNIDHYRDAVLDLVSLYIARGYPSGWIKQWNDTNMERRWHTRYESSNLSEGEEEHGGFVVLKSTFNPTLNFFRANELAEAVVGEWRKYCNWYALGIGSVPQLEVFDKKPTPAPAAEDISFSRNLDESVVMYRNSPDPSGTGALRLGDVTKLNSLMRARWVVSRRRNRNLFDLANLWKRTVLRSYQNDLFSEDGSDIDLPLPAVEADAEEGAAFAGSLSWDTQPTTSLSGVGGKHRREPSGDLGEESSRVRVRRRFGWEREAETSTVTTGLAAPRGQITRYVQKRDRSDTQPEPGPSSSKRGRGFRPR